jgi:hypothetical protein
MTQTTTVSQWMTIVVLNPLWQEMIAARFLVFCKHLAMFIENLFIITITYQVLHLAGVVLYVD